MWKKLGFQIYKTEKGFKTYFRWQRDEAIRKLDHLEHATFSLSETEIEEYMALRKLLKLDSLFFSSLSLGEKVALQTINKMDELNKYGRDCINSAYKKWEYILFGEGGLFNVVIEKATLGMVIAKIRKSKGYSKTYISRLTKVSLKTIYRIENGETLPCLDGEVTEVIDMEMIEDEINVRIDHPMTKKTILYLSLEYLSTKFNLLNYIQKVQRNVVLI